MKLLPRLNFRKIAAMIALAGSASAAQSASAATYTWAGGATGGWATAANWTPTGFPISGNTSSSLMLQFSSRSSAYSSTDNVTNPFSLNRIDFETGTGSAQTTITIAAGSAPLTFVSDSGTMPSIVQNSSGGFLINGAGTTGVGGIVLKDNLTLKGTGSGLVNISTIVSGTAGITVDGGATFALAGVNTYSGGTTVKAGTLQFGTGSATVLGSGALTVEGGRISSVSSTQKTLANAVGVTAGATATFGSTVQTGALTFNGAATFGNGAKVIADSNLTFAGSITTNGNLTLAPKQNAVMTLSSLNIAGGVTLELALGANPLVITGALTNSTASKLNFDLSGGTIGQVYTLINFGSTTLTYADLNLLTGSYVLDQSFGTGGWQINGNNLQVQLIPEPSAVGMLLTGVSALGAFSLGSARRSRKRLKAEVGAH